MFLDPIKNRHTADSTKERFLRETLITIDTLCAVVWILLSFIVQYHLKINACTFSIFDSIFISCTCKVWVWEQYQSSFDLHAYRQNKQNIYYRQKKDFSPIKYTIFKLKSKILLINWWTKIYYANKVQQYNRKIVQSSTLFFFV